MVNVIRPTQECVQNLWNMGNVKMWVKEKDATWAILLNHVKGTTKCEAILSEIPADRRAQEPQVRDFLGNIQSEIVKLKESQSQEIVRLKESQAQEMDCMRQEMVSMRHVRQIEYQTPPANKDQELINMIKAWVARN